MEKVMKLNMSCEINKTKSKTFIVHFKDHEIASWCSNLSLLKYNLISVVSLITDNGVKLEIRMDSKLNAKIANRRGKVSFDHDTTKLVISLDELDYWLFFFLEYYRDGMSEVPDVDLDITIRDKELGCSYFYLTFLVPNVKPVYLSPDALKDIKKLLES